MATFSDPPLRDPIEKNSRTWMRWFVELKDLVTDLSVGTGFNLTPSRAVEINSSGTIIASAITATELNYLDGVTSNLQTQFSVLTSYANIYTAGSSTGLTLTDQNTWYKFVAFTANGPANTLTADHTNDHITDLVSGTYLVLLSSSFSLSVGSHDIEGQIYSFDGDVTYTALPAAQFDRFVGAGGDIGAASISAIVTTSDPTLEFWVRRTTAGTAPDFVGRDVSFSVKRLL